MAKEIHIKTKNSNQAISICMALTIFAFLSALPLSSGIQATGIVLDAEAAPGDEINHEIIISTDKNESPMDFQVDVVDMVQGTDGSNNAINDTEEHAYSAKSFLQVSPEKFHLEPGELQEITVKGAIPGDVGNGGRYAIIRAYTVNPEDKNGTTSMGISISMNTVVRITIAGSQLIREGEISQIIVDTPVSNEQQNVSVQFKNTGNTHYKAQIDALLKDRDGTVLANTSSLLTNYIIPETLRVFDLSFHPGKSFEPGEYNVSVSARLEDGTVLDSAEAAFKI